MKPLILDTSTLILIAKIDLLDLLIAKAIVKIPVAVKEEATRKRDLADARLITRLIEEKKIKVVKISGSAWARKLMDDFRLGVGEAEAITLAKEENAILGIDDGPAIKVCKVAGVLFTNSLGLLFRFYEKGEVDRESALAKIERLKKYGWYREDLLIKVAEDIRRRR